MFLILFFFLLSWACGVRYRPLSQLCPSYLPRVARGSILRSHYLWLLVGSILEGLPLAPTCAQGQQPTRLLIIGQHTRQTGNQSPWPNMSLLGV